jgi:hypothetical protein
MYRFWISGDDSAELLVSNDSEPINLFSRATLATATGFQAWTAAAQAPILWLEAGQRYYWEARTVNQLDTGHVSVGWLLPSQGGADPMAASTPGSVIPAYALSPWLDNTPTETVGTLYTTAMAAQGTNLTGAYGSGTLLVNEAGTQAALRFSYANLSAPKTGNHIHSAAHGGAIIFDIDTAVPEADGSHVWTFAPVGAISVADIKAVIASGQAFLNIHTANYPAGEISGPSANKPARSASPRPPRHRPGPMIIPTARPPSVFSPRPPTGLPKPTFRRCRHSATRAGSTNNSPSRPARSIRSFTPAATSPTPAVQPTPVRWFSTPGGSRP